MELFYKVLDHDRMPYHGGSGQWPEPGVWHQVKGPVIPCASGLHLCRNLRQVLNWLGPEIWLVEIGTEAERIDLEDKTVVSEARLVRQLWDATITRLFAADCAEHVLHLFETRYPNDLRPRNAIVTARRYANGEVNEDELDVAWAAARDATRGATRGAAKGAAQAAAWAAARDAAWAAAWAAANGAACAAARDAERDWQVGRLAEYLGVSVS